MSFGRLKEITEGCYDGGQNWVSSFRKVPAIGSLAQNWTDLSGAPGNPKPNYYTGAELSATLLSGNNGIFHGGDVAPETKHLHKILIGSVGAGVTPATFILCDYLLFYPLIDMDSTDDQFLDNTVTLPRYADGRGVQAFLVATNPYLGGAQFSFTYTNSDGVSGRQSKIHTSNTATFINTIVNTGTAATSYGPFLQPVKGDLGIRSVDSITFLAPNGGLAALVLVKPIATVMLNEISAFSETDFLTMKPSLPRIYDGAYLNFICNPNGSVAAVPIMGEATFIWS